jgi:signal transduction histidine kinase
VRKHARPERVEVRLEYLPDQVSLAVEDYGIPPEGAEGVWEERFPPRIGGIRGVVPPGQHSPPGRYGLTGMRERAELLGGILDAAPTNTGFRVLLKVPA